MLRKECKEDSYNNEWRDRRGKEETYKKNNARKTATTWNEEITEEKKKRQ